MSKRPRCGLCGEPMPEGEENFQYHGYSGPCPMPPTKEEPQVEPSERREWKEFYGTVTVVINTIHGETRDIVPSGHVREVLPGDERLAMQYLVDQTQWLELSERHARLREKAQAVVITENTPIYHNEEDLLRLGASIEALKEELENE